MPSLYFHKFVPKSAFFQKPKSSFFLMIFFAAMSPTAIKVEEDKVTRSIKDAAKKGQKDVCSILAKEIIRSRKAVNKIYASKAQLNSVEMSMKNQLGE